MNTKKLKLTIAIILFFLPATGYSQSNKSNSTSNRLYHQQALQGMADKLLCLFDNMPSVRVLVQEHERFKKKKHVRGFFTYFEGVPTIIVNPKWVRKASYLKLENTIKHELIHAWLSWKGIHESVNEGHGELFLRKGMEIGLDVKGTVNKYPKLKPVYKRLKKERELSGSTILRPCSSQ